MAVSRDLVGGAIALALAVGYYAAAAALPVSLLSDEVGADGVPKALAVALGLCGIVLLVRTALRRGPSGGEAEPEATDWRAHLRAVGLLGLAVAYVAVTPFIGYLLATIALLFAVTAYAGQPISLRMAAVSILGGAALWLSFAKVLGVAMPPAPFI